MGLFGSSGLKSAASSVSQIIASLVGQDIVAKSIRLTQASGSDAVKMVDGAKVNFSTADSFAYIAWVATNILFMPGGLSLGNDTGTLSVRRAGNPFFTADPATNTLTVSNGAGVGIISFGSELRFISYTDDSANSGNRTVNNVRGKSAFAIGAATVTITNSFVTANSQIVCTLEFGDATLTQILRCIPGAGSFVATGNANATAATKFSWTVLN